MNMSKLEFTWNMANVNWLFSLSTYLDYVQNGDVTMMIRFIQTSGDHHILRLQQSSHHIQNGRLTHIYRMLWE